MTLGVAGVVRHRRALPAVNYCNNEQVPHWSMETQVAVHLDGRAAWRDVRTGRTATNADIQACLSALDALLLRGSFYAGPERTFLRNVTMTAARSASSVFHSTPNASSNKIPTQSPADASEHDTHVLKVKGSAVLLTPFAIETRHAAGVGVTGHSATSCAAAAGN
jgi:hypothetical protein